MRATIVIAALFAFWSGAASKPAIQLSWPRPAADTSFYSLLGRLVTDSLWPRDQAPPARYFVTSNESLVYLRRAAIAVDSTYPARYIACRDNPATAALVGDGVAGWVLSVSVGRGIDSSTYALHLTVGCKVGSGDSIRATGHYCAWDIVPEGSRWRILRSRRCWALTGE